MFKTWSLAVGAVQEVVGDFRCRTQWRKQIVGGVTVKGVLATCLFPAVLSAPCYVVYLTFPEDPQQWNPVLIETPEASEPKKGCPALNCFSQVFVKAIIS